MASHFPVYTLNGSFRAGPRVHGATSERTEEIVRRRIRMHET